MVAKKKVLFAIGSLTMGGAERLVIELANRFDRTAWEPHVVCLMFKGEQANLLSDRVPLHLLNKKPGFDYGLLKRIQQLVADIQPAVINTHLWTANTWMRAALRGRVPVVVTEHNRDEWKSWHHKMIDRYLARSTAKMITVSNDSGRFYHEQVGIPSGLIEVIYNGIDVDNYATGQSAQVREELGIEPDRLLIGMVGRLVPQKNHMRFLESVEIMKQRGSNALCLIVGDGPERPKLEAAAAEKDLMEHVRFLGSRADVPDILQALDIFTLSSDREGHPLTALEAQAAGVPVVLTDVGGSADALSREGDKAGGILVPPDAQALADGWLQLINDDQKRAQMSQFAADHTRKHFGLARMVQDYESLLASVS